VKLRRGDWPVLIGRIVDDIVELAKKRGVRGAVSVHEVDEGSVRHYEIIVKVPASETVAAHGSGPRPK